MKNTDIDNLKDRASLIRNANEANFNTAERVGGLMYNMVEGIEDALDVELNDLNNVEINNPSNDQVISYDSGARKWKNTAVPGGGGGGGGSTGKEKMYFLNRTHNDTPPATPSVRDYSSSTDQFAVGGNTWTSNNTNPGSNQDTWAIWVWFTDDTHPSTISDPVRIYNSANGGGGGSNGEDGEEVEFIYCTSIVEFDAITKSTIASALAVFTNDGNKVTADVTVGGVTWSNHPHGVSQSVRFEYSAVRHSSLDSNGKRVWTSGFSGPYLWSAFGERGTDGDGVEYIFTVNTGELPTGNRDPSTWTNDPDFQNPEYIRSGTGWEDEPQTLQPGQIQWVSVRKKQIPQGGDGKTAYWQAYSSPVVWGRYALDGVAEGYIVDLSNENMPAGTSEEGELDGYTNTCKVSVFHNGIPMTYSSATSAASLGSNEFGYTIGTITRSDSASSTGITATKNNDIVTVSADDVTGFDNKNAFIPISVILPDDLGTRDKIITLYGIPTGEAGQTVDLYVSAAAIKEDCYHQNVYPATLEIGVRIGKGDSMRLYKVGEDDQEIAELGYSFEYFYNGDSEHPFVVSAPFNPRTSSEQVSIETLTFTMKYNNTIIDAENLPYVHEPAPGIGIDAVTYNIDAVSSSITKYATGKISGELKYRITKTIGDTTKYLFPSGGNNYWVLDPNNPTFTELADESVVVNVNGIGPVVTSYDIYNGLWFFNQGEANFSVPYSQIIIYSSTHMPLRSAVIPFIVEGQKGDVQSINGTVIRFRNWNEMTNPNSQHTGDELGAVAIGALAASDGVIYKDVMVYETRYFYIAPSYTGSLDPDVVTETGKEPIDAHGDVRTAYYQEIPMLGDAAFQVLLAKYAYIENLTAAEIVITDATTQQPIAGMTRGSGTGIYPTGENPIADSKRGNVRIWAGYSAGTANLNDSKFYVTDEGFLHAENAEITGNIIATSGEFNGIVKASLMYSGVATVTSEYYTINPATQPYNAYLIFTSINYLNHIILPNPESYEGLEIRLFVPEVTRYSGAAYLENSNGINFRSAEGLLVQSNTVVLGTNEFITVKAMPDVFDNDSAWYVVSGGVEAVV